MRRRPPATSTTNAGLVRIGVAADLVQVTAWVFLALTLFALLRHVSDYAARAMVVLVAIGAAISCLNILFEFEGMRLATEGTGLSTAGAAGADALALLMLDLQHYGYAIAGIFFGLWLVPLGYLAFMSGMFPKALGVVLVVAGISYLVDTLAAIVAPDLTPIIHPVAGLLGVVAEVWMLAYLLVKGVRDPRPEGRPSDAGSPSMPACRVDGSEPRTSHPPWRRIGSPQPYHGASGAPGPATEGVDRHDPDARR